MSCGYHAIYIYMVYFRCQAGESAMFRWLVIELRVYPLEDFADALHLIVVEFGAVRLLAVLDSVVERGHVRWCIYIDPLEFRQVHATHHDGVGHALQYHCHHCGNNAHEHQTCQGFRVFHSLICYLLYFYDLVFWRKTTIVFVSLEIIWGFFLFVVATTIYFCDI